MDKQQCIDAIMKGKFNDIKFLFQCAKEENEQLYNAKLAQYLPLINVLPLMGGLEVFSQMVIDYYRRKFNLTFLIFNNQIIKIY